MNTNVNMTMNMHIYIEDEHERKREREYEHDDEDGDKRKYLREDDVGFFSGSVAEAAGRLNLVSKESNRLRKVSQRPRLCKKQP